MGIRDDEDEEETTEDAPEEEEAGANENEKEPDEDEESPDEEAEAPPPEQAAPPVNNTPLGDPATAVSPEDRAKAIQDYLMTKYGEAADDSGIKSARESAGNTNLVANVGHAFETMGRANSMAHGGSGVDERFYQGLKNEGQQGVQQAMMDRQSKINQFLQENALKQQVAQSMFQRGDIETKQKAQQAMQGLQQQKLDLEKELGHLKYETISADTKLKVDQLKETAKGRAQMAAERDKDRQAAREDKQSDKEEAQLDKQEHDFTSDLNSEKGRAGNYGKNMQRVQAGDRIMSLINSKDASGNPIDPNQLTPTQVAEIARDFDAMQGMGGTGSVETFKHILPSSMKGDAAKFWSYVEGGPQPANMGEFVKQLQDSTLRQRETALSAAKKTETAMSEGYDKLRTKRPDRYRQILNNTVASQMAAEAPSSINNVGSPSGGPPAQTKNIGGVTYYKVPGGWSQTPMAQTAGQ